MANAEQFGDEMRKLAADAAKSAIANSVVQLVIDGVPVAEVPFKDGAISFPGFTVEETAGDANGSVDLVTPDGQRESKPAKITKR